MKNAICTIFGVFFLLSLSPDLSFSQDTIPNIVNATGGHYSNTTAQLDFSVGEVSITPLSSAQNIISVGFLQPPFAATLAISLIDFTGTLTPAGQVALSWSTEQEINNNHFDVERSADGISFVKLLTVAGSGNSVIQQDYKAIDPSPFNNVTYYRLKQVNNDGSFTYSRVIAITTGTGGTSFVVSPNPFATSINIRPSGQKPFLVKIYDMGGRLVTQNNYPGAQTSIDLSALASGMYFLRLYSKDGNFIQSIKITKQ